MNYYPVWRSSVAGNRRVRRLSLKRPPAGVRHAADPQLFDNKDPQALIRRRQRASASRRRFILPELATETWVLQVRRATSRRVTRRDLIPCCSPQTRSPLVKRNGFCNFPHHGTTGSFLDEALAERVSRHMREAGISATALAGQLGIAPSTLTRSMNERAFSDDMASRLRAELKPAATASDDRALLQKALLLLRESDRLRVRAERLVAEYLDDAPTSR